MSLMGVEIGTTGCTAVVYAIDGRELSCDARRYPMGSPEPGAKELDADEVIAQVCAAIAGAANAAGHDPVRAISVAAIGETVILANEAGQPLAPALTTFDSRPTPEAEEWAREIGREQVQQITGLALHPMFSLPKISWWQHRRRDLVRQTRWIFGFDSLLLLRMGLPPVTDYSLAGRTMALDLRAGNWSEVLLRQAGVAAEQMPRLAPAGTALGVLSDTAAEAFGLPVGTRVVVGGHDQACAALGSDVYAPGTVMDATGLGECLAIAQDEPVINAAMLAGHYGCYPHVVPGRYLTLAFHFNGAALWQWYIETLGSPELREAQQQGLDYDELTRNRNPRGPSPILVLPHFSAAGTPWLRQPAQGAIVGLTLTTSPEDILHGVYDSTEFEVRLNLDRLAEAGVHLARVHAVGEGVSPRRLQRKADVFQLPVRKVIHPDAVCRGAAILAGVGTGVYSNIEEGVAHLVILSPPIEPAADMRDAYARQYARYRKLYPALQPVLEEG